MKKSGSGGTLEQLGEGGTTRSYDLNLNVTKEYLHDRPDGHTYAREVESIYHTDLRDRVKQVRHKLVSSGKWIDLTSPTTLPTYFAMGGMKTIRYANGVDETNTKDKAYRLTRRQATSGATVLSDLTLTYDVGSNITTYKDLGYRHLEYHTVSDALYRLQCLSRSIIGAGCSGAEPWEDAFHESFVYDLAGNRTKRKYEVFEGSKDTYTYVSGTDVIDGVSSGEGPFQDWSNDFRGNLSSVKYKSDVFEYTWVSPSGLADVLAIRLVDAIEERFPFPGNARLRVVEEGKRETTRSAAKDEASIGLLDEALADQAAKRGADGLHA